MELLEGGYLVKLDRRDYYEQPMIAHWCPACEEIHPFSIEKKQRNKSQWTWNGSLTEPTFNPSMNITIGPYPDDHSEPGFGGKIYRCHYFLNNGFIDYLGDCTHKFKGRSIILPKLPNHYVEQAKIIILRQKEELGKLP